MDKAMNDKMQKVSAIMMLCANYAAEMPDELLDIWLGLLREYSPEAVNRGVVEVINTYDYKTRPPFAVLRKAIDSVCGIRRLDQEEAIRIEAEAEWDALLDDIATYGSYRQPDLHPTTEFVLHGMGGWESACAWETARLEWRHKDFVEKWVMAYGRENAMAYGAYGVKKLVEGPQSAAMILGRDNNQRAIEQ